MAQDKKQIMERKYKVYLTEDEIHLSLVITEKLKPIIRYLYYLMRHKGEEAFTVMLISSHEVDIEKMLRKEKRDTDILLEIDKMVVSNQKRFLYAIVCQDTEVDGGYYFAKRLMPTLTSTTSQEIYCAELEVRRPSYDAEDVVFRATTMYFDAVKEKKAGEIILKSIG